MAPSRAVVKPHAALMIVRSSGVTKPGSVCKRPVEFIVVFPALFDLCGIPQPSAVEAIGMKPLLEEPGEPGELS